MVDQRSMFTHPIFQRNDPIDSLNHGVMTVLADPMVFESRGNYRFENETKTLSPPVSYPNFFEKFLAKDRLTEEDPRCKL